MFISDSVNGKCSNCGGDVIEYSIPNPVWNLIVRRNGKEHDNEYLCIWCFTELVVEYFIDVGC